MTYFLHEEIIEILITAQKEMTVSEIHKNIKHYRRRDGKFPPAYQVRAHINDYKKYFYNNKYNKPLTVGLREWL